NLLFQHLMTPIDTSFNILHVKLPHFVVPWHFHKEIEIMYVIKGEGTRFVGDSVQNLSEGDLVIVGSQTPHDWRNHQKHYERKGLIAECLVLFFREESFGESFLSTPEMSNIRGMIHEAKRGIKYTDGHSSRLKTLMMQAYQERGMKRLLTIMDMLQ